MIILENPIQYSCPFNLHPATQICIERLKKQTDFQYTMNETSTMPGVSLKSIHIQNKVLHDRYMTQFGFQHIFKPTSPGIIWEYPQIVSKDRAKHCFRYECTFVSTSKSVSEALIFESVNPQYDEKLFIQFPEKYKIKTFCVQILFWMSKQKQKTICGLTDARMRASEKDLPVWMNFCKPLEKTCCMLLSQLWKEQLQTKSVVSTRPRLNHFHAANFLPVKHPKLHCMPDFYLCLQLFQWA